MTETLTDDTVEFDREEYLPDLRGLVLSEGRPYILITVVDPETGGVEVTSSGLAEGADLPTALQEIALLLAVQHD